MHVMLSPGVEINPVLTNYLKLDVYHKIGQALCS